MKVGDSCTFVAAKNGSWGKMHIVAFIIDTRIFVWKADSDSVLFNKYFVLDEAIAQVKPSMG